MKMTFPEPAGRCLGLAAGLVWCTTVGAQPLALQDGDIVFHTSRSAQSLAVQQATGSRYSHMGMVLIRQGQPWVFEAEATVRYTPLARWVARGNGGHVVAKRLQDAAQRLTPAAVARLHTVARQYEGRPYDLTFEWSDQRLYCSELVWKVYRQALGIELGALQQIKDFKLDAPVVRAKLRERYGDRVPLEEPVISPVAMFEAPQLVTVAER